MSRSPKPWYRKDRKSWFVTINGRRIRLGPNRDAAFKKFYALMSAPRRRGAAGGSLLTLIDRFLEYTHEHRSADTYTWYQTRLELFARRYPDLAVDDLRPIHVQDWVDDMKGISNGTRRNYIRSIQRCMKWCEEMGLVDRSPISHIRKPRAGKREVVISPQVWNNLLAKAGDESFVELLEFHYETGCRPQESLRAEARHADLGNSRLVLPESESKSGWPRIIYLNGSALEIVRRRVIRYPSGKLFRNSAGVPWTTDAVNNAFTRIQLRQGLEIMRERGIELTEDEICEFTLSLNPKRRRRGRLVAKHSRELREEARRKLRYRKARELAPKYCLYHIRHTWMNRMLLAGVDALSVAILAGHRDPSMLARCYQHLSQSPDFLLSQAKRLENGLRNATNGATFPP